jgi:hypothetical protein
VRRAPWLAALALVIVVSAAAPSRAGLLGIFSDGSGNDFLGAIDAETGEITTRGSVLPLGNRIGGLADADPVTGSFFFVGTENPSADVMSIWTVDVSDGSVVGVHPISLAGFTSGPFCIRWDGVHHRLLAVMQKTPAVGTLATISPATGATAAIGGTGFAVDGLYSGVCAFDPVGQRLYYVTPLGGHPALFAIDASTGAVVSSPAITTGLPGVGDTPVFLAWDAAGDRVLGVVSLNPGTAGKVLVSIDRTTGALTLLSDAIPASGYAEGASAWHEPSHSLYFLDADGTNTHSTLFGVNTNGLVVANSALVSDFVGLFTTSSFLVIAPEPSAWAAGLAALASLLLCARRRRSA